jgi:hypothetical protein
MMMNIKWKLFPIIILVLEGIYYLTEFLNL